MSPLRSAVPNGSQQVSDTHLIQLTRDRAIGRQKAYPRGSVLFWQGDPVDRIFLILEGAVKISTLSEDGRLYTHDILGPGRLLGATPYLLGTAHDSTAESLDDARCIVAEPAAFEAALAADREFSVAVMRELAAEARDSSGKAEALSFLDVQSRIRNSLIGLAAQHGIATDRGIKIDLIITHEDIGALVSANRTTITACMSELRKKGYLWKEGRRFIIIPPAHMEALDALEAAVADGDDRAAQDWAQKACGLGIDPQKALEALSGGMRQVDRRYSHDEIELPDVVAAAFAMKSAIPVMEQGMSGRAPRAKSLGAVAIGTVRGDIHDIGKTMVAMSLRARGFSVLDLGVDVPAEGFVRAVRETHPDILALSALTTTTAPEAAGVIQALDAEGLRRGVKVIMGGGAVSPEYAQRAGADGFGFNARKAVEQAWRLVTWK
jgi:methanogenic corrinoid protein MtbC1